MGSWLFQSSKGIFRGWGWSLAPSAHYDMDGIGNRWFRYDWVGTGAGDMDEDEDSRYGLGVGDMASFFEIWHRYT